jgi:hypothetical protein
VLIKTYFYVPKIKQLLKTDRHMKQNYMRMMLTICLVYSSFLAGSQTQQQIEEIRNNSDLDKLQRLERRFNAEQTALRQRALTLAQANNWPVTYTDQNGKFYGLVGVSEDNKPIYYQTDDIAAARSTRTDWLHNGGGLGLDIEGQGMTAFVWDGGVARTTHQEYDGVGGENRFTNADGGTRNFHAAHVMGTIISSGVESNAKGMAPQARGFGYDWNNDITEATQAVQNNGMLISNHSYGFGAENLDDDWFGSYINRSREWDELMYAAPYYMMVVSAGNDGNDNTSNANPLEGNGFYDKLSGFKTTKNNIVVANGQDAQIDSDGNLISVVRNSSSSEGPTDDLRIKPEIMGNGTGVRSTYHDADDSYNFLSGTSMSSPNVAGSLLLLQQYYNELNGTFMRSSTLKALALHTTDDVGQAGPDAQHGWGLMNTRTAAETLTNNGFQTWVAEEVLEQGETFTITVQSDGVNPLQASICWTDLPGSISGQANSSTPILVNDLDIRVTQDTDTFEPWRLTSVQGNGKGDNIVDPYERVDVDGASGEYTITVTHKGTLADGPQAFALVISGLDSNFRFNTETASQVVCSDVGAEFTFDYEQIGTVTTNFSVEGLPGGATADFSSPSLDANGTTTLTLSDLEDIPAGIYELVVVGDDGTETERRSITLQIYHPNFDNNPVLASYPANGERDIPFAAVNLTWDENINAESFEIEISDSPAFTNIIDSGTETDVDFTVSGLASQSVYYWRVRPTNRCATGDFSEIFSFQTGGEDCSNTYEATNYGSSQIFDNPSTASVPVDIGDDLTINRLIVNADITHRAVDDLIITLQQPGTLGGAETILLQNACDETDDLIGVSFDDTAGAVVCNATSPAITGSVAPVESLAGSAGLSASGRWFFTVTDNVFLNGGNIDFVSITVCSALSNAAAPDFVNNGFDVAANGSYTIETSDIEASTATETAGQQVYTVVVLPSRGNLVRNGVTLAVGDTFTQEDVDNGLMEYTNTQQAIFTDSFKVDIINAGSEWLSNQTINVTSSVVSTESFELANFALYPNPSYTGNFTLKFETNSSAQVGVQLFDLQGRRILTREFTSDQTTFEESIPVGNLASGIYLVRVNQGNRSTTRNLIISR